MSSRWRRILYPSRLFTPRGLLVRAVLLTAILLLHIFGLREYTCIFSGTSPTGGQPPDLVTASLGATYAVLYLLVVLVVPIATLAAGFLLALQRWPATWRLRRGRRGEMGARPRGVASERH